MPSENRPASNQDAPDPARSYERAKPEKEAGAGGTDSTHAVPSQQPDRQQQAVINRQDGTRQINADDTDQRKQSKPDQPDQPDHSMMDEEPLGWDQAPKDIKDPRAKRHPRTEGKGGTP